MIGKMRLNFAVVSFICAGLMSASGAFAGGLPEAKDDKAATATANEQVSGAGANSNTNSGVNSNTNSGANSNTNSGGDSHVDGFVAIEDDPLIIDATAIRDDDGLGEVSVQWQILSSNNDWTNLTGATHQSFTPRQVHVGHRLRVVISYVDGQGNLETLISPSSTPVKNINDKPSGAPILLGDAIEGDALVVDTSTIADEDGIGSYEVIWQRSSTKTEWQAFANATSEVLRLSQEHIGFSYRSVITYVDNYGSREVLISNPSETVLNVDDPVEGEVLLSGDAIEGGVLAVDTNSVSDEDGIASLSVSWEGSSDGRNWSAIDGTNQHQINLHQPHVGLQIRAKASVVDSFGVETLIYSQPSNAIENVNNAPSGSINVRRVGG